MPTAAHAFDTSLIARYDTRAPRYTSYPTADRFHPGVGAGEHQRALRTRSRARCRSTCTCRSARALAFIAVAIAKSPGNPVRS